MAVWDTIREYQRAAWTRQAVLMDAIGLPASFGATSNTDNGLLNHNLSAQITDAAGVTWTATSVGAAPTGFSCQSIREFVTGTLTAGNQTDWVMAIKPLDPTSVGSGLKQKAD
jgi:hypothetical protein